jgi:membrane protein DedA with SNARE-associated domain
VFEQAALGWYGFFFTLLIMAGMGFPIPEELPIVTAGAMVGHGSGSYDFVGQLAGALDGMSNDLCPAMRPGLIWSLQTPVPSSLPSTVRLYWYIMLPVLIIGVVISDGILYSMGRIFGTRLLEFPVLKRLMPPERRRRIEENFHKYGIWVLLFARFMPTIRSPIFIMAGVTRLPLIRFLLADGIYAIPGVSLLFFLAFWFGDQFREMVVAAETKVALARPILIMAAIAGVAAYLIYHFMRHPVATGDPREEIPVIGGQVAAKITHESHEPPARAEAEWKPPGETPSVDGVREQGSGNPLPNP